MLGHEKVGTGPSMVIVTNDWLCDTSTWDGARAYLDVDRFTWVFADLRGYGRSRQQRGAFTLEEAAGDVLALASALGAERFAMVGHSMSSLIALHLAQHDAERLARAVVLTPPPPAGFGTDEAGLVPIRALARSGDSTRLSWLRGRFGERMSDGWARFKAERWRATTDPDAAAAYAAMFAQRGLPTPNARIDIPLLAVTGEQDIDIMRAASVTDLLSPICPQLTVIALADCGHYPMQEAPPRLVAIVERFLAQ
jgi:pimeloyl-ACP methyl ester carboxylesterase